MGRELYDKNGNSASREMPEAESLDAAYSDGMMFSSQFLLPPRNRTRREMDPHLYFDSRQHSPAVTGRRRLTFLKNAGKTRSPFAPRKYVLSRRGCEKIVGCVKRTTTCREWCVPRTLHVVSLATTELISSQPRSERRQYPAVILPLFLSLLIFVSGLTGSVLAEGNWKAGVARAVITPENSVWLAGYGSKRAPDGKLHDLWMKALALEDIDGHRVVLVTSDFQGVPKSMSDRVFEQLKRKLKLERHQVMLTFSHNHCGPRLGDDLVDYYPIDEEQVKLIDEYTSKMVVACVAMVEESLSKLAPARLQQGVGTTTFAVNRRENREAEVPELLAKGVPLKGPVDHAVPVMTVIRPDGKLEAVLFGYACHPTTLSFLTWCGDYPGFAQLEIEESHPGAMAMFVNTCGGDQNPLPRRSVELCQRYGHMLSVAVEDVLKQDRKPISPRLRTAFEYIALPYLKVVEREELVAWQDDGNAIKKRWAERLLKKLLDGEKFSESYPYPVHAWRLGDEMLVIGMGAETVVDYALRFKREFGPGTWVCGYADDMIAYIPSRRVWEEGGYEGGSNLYEYGRPALRWGGDIEEFIAQSVHKLVKQVKEE